jgi:uroporphyrinogen-III synthase
MKRVLITRPKSQADAFATALSAAGFEPVFFPVIEIRPMADLSELDQALQNLASYDWVVFTSVNGVDVFWSRLADLALTGLPLDLRVAAIGPKTAEALRNHGASADYVPLEYIAEAILPGLGDLNGRRVLLPRAEIARKALPEAIIRSGGSVHEIPVYQTLPAHPSPRSLDALRSGVDVITFTSPSTVHSFFAIARDAGLDPLHLPGRPLVACIGPITAAAASQEGLPVDLVSEEYTSEGLVNLLKDKVNE